MNQFYTKLINDIEEFIKWKSDDTNAREKGLVKFKEEFDSLTTMKYQLFCYVTLYGKTKQINITSAPFHFLIKLTDIFGNLSDNNLSCIETKDFWKLIKELEVRKSHIDRYNKKLYNTES